MVMPVSEDDAGFGPYELTERGRVAAERLVAERRATLERLLEGWQPEQHPELVALMSRLADEVGQEPDEELVHH
jgi:hypothetical protein